MTFVFDKDYHNLEQVRPWLPEFSAIREEITSAGGYPYNDSFKGRIPGISNTDHHGSNSGTHEEAAIYLLQKLYRAEENVRRISAAIADGCRPLDTLPCVVKFSRVIVYDDQDRMRGPIWEEWQDARIVPDANDRPRVVLPKGKRNYGHAINGRKVMVAA